MKHKTSHKSW